MCNGWDLPGENFTVLACGSHPERPAAGRHAESGALKFGQVKHTNLTLRTEIGV